MANRDWQHGYNSSGRAHNMNDRYLYRNAGQALSRPGTKDKAKSQVDERGEGPKSKALVPYNKHQSRGQNEVRDLTHHRSRSKDHGSSRKDSNSTSKGYDLALQKWTDYRSSHDYNDKHGDRMSQSKTDDGALSNRYRSDSKALTLFDKYGSTKALTKYVDPYSSKQGDHAYPSESNELARARQSYSNLNALVPFDKHGSTKALSKYFDEHDRPFQQESPHQHRSSHRHSPRSRSPSPSLRPQFLEDSHITQDILQVELLKSVKELQSQVKDTKIEMSNSEKALAKPSSSPSQHHFNASSSRHGHPDTLSHRPKHSSRLDNISHMDWYEPSYPAPTVPPLPTMNNTFNNINFNLNSQNTSIDINSHDTRGSPYRYRCRDCGYV